ncbi:MAG: 6,7-dimethyl-8-ribityllumazine synthase, partial [Bacteroidia bacterium]
MSSVDKNLSAFSSLLPDGSSYKIGIVCAEWNEKITTSLFKGAAALLQQAGVLPQNIVSLHVPGTFELPLAAQKFAKNPEIDGV